MEDTEFYTATMAKVYADQGHTEKALEIYRYILDREPQRSDIAATIAELKVALSKKAPAIEKRLVELFHEWFALMLTDARLTSLKLLRKNRHS